MKLSDIVSKSLGELMQMSKAELRSAFGTLSRTLTARGKVFQKLGVKQKIPKSFKEVRRQGLQNVGEDELRQAVGLISGYFRGKMSMPEEALAEHNRQREMLKSRFGLEHLSDEDFDKYGAFMDDMQRRMGKQWAYGSAQAKKIALEALRLNLDPSQFIENFEYWSDHLKELEQLKPIEATGPLTLSDYVAQTGGGYLQERVTGYKAPKRRGYRR